MTARTQPAPIGVILETITTAPYVRRLARHAQPHRVGRPPVHPPWVLFAYAALVRHFRSASYTDIELRHGLWDRLRHAAIASELDDPGARPYLYHHFTYQRDRLVSDDETLEMLTNEFTVIAVDHARQIGLLRPNGPGSLTYPHPARTIYGDGTIVRPIYRPPKPHDYVDCPVTGSRRPRYLDPATGELSHTPSRRHDPSAADHGRHDGIVNGNDFIMFSARGSHPGSRVILGVDRVPAPGREADTAIGVIGRIHRSALGGIQAVVYDGAFQGVHIDRVMRSTGLIVVNKVAAATRTEDGTATPKRRALGIHSHDTSNGKCPHVLHSVNGSVVDVALSDDGSPVDVATAKRKQVKRAARKDGTYRYNLAVTLPCKGDEVTIWLSPHDNPEHIRLVPPDDPYFQTLYALRNDAESLNAQYKKTLLVDRATSVGWRRQLFDLLAYAILHNSLTADQPERRRRLTVA